MIESGTELLRVGVAKCLEVVERADGIGSREAVDDGLRLDVVVADGFVGEFRLHRATAVLLLFPHLARGGIDLLFAILLDGLMYARRVGGAQFNGACEDAVSREPSRHLGRCVFVRRAEHHRREVIVCGEDDRTAVLLLVVGEDDKDRVPRC